jgi:heme exporter protein D
VGGSGATKNCWNLKGSPGMEEDFDELNSLLKFYYLLQASYHLHSAAFHVLTLGIMWTRHKKRPAQLANWRSILQHSIALVLIVGSHLFASTRRLGAIGSFVLDLSSLLLHALQVFINAPYSLDPTVVKVVHLGLVIPVFVYCRFYVWPFVVWRSAWLESKDWLQQMESTLFPGIYVAMMWVFHGLTLILLGLNMVLLKRLVNHPHLQRVYDKRRRQARSRSNVSPILS